MLVQPYYSQFRGIAVEDVWHDNDECQIGLSIAPLDRLPGKGLNRRHCSYCLMHNTPLGKITCS